MRERTCGGEGAAGRCGLTSSGRAQSGSRVRACRVPTGGGETERAEPESASVLPARALHQALALRIIRSRQRRSGPVDDMAADADADADADAMALHVCACADASSDMDAESTANLSAEAARAGDVGELLGVRPDAAEFT